MADIKKEFGFGLRDGKWCNCENKACTHGYSKTMNQPRFKQVSNVNDLGFSGSDKKTSLEALDFDLESTIESVEYDLKN